MVSTILGGMRGTSRTLHVGRIQIVKLLYL